MVCDVPPATTVAQPVDRNMRLSVNSTNMRVSVAAAGLPGRYAAALFDLAVADKALDRTSADLSKLQAALTESADLRALIEAPQIARKDAGEVVARLGQALGLSDLSTKFLGVLAANGRLAALPAIIRQFDVMLGAHNNRLSAQVTSAQPLSAKQKKALEAKLKSRTGRDMAVDVTVDPAILGGLIVRIGSEQIDSSVKTRLERLGQQMKGL